MGWFNHPSLPEELLFLVMFFDEHWNEIEDMRTWTNDIMRVQRWCSILRQNEFNRSKGDPLEYGDFFLARSISVEVRSGRS